MFSLNTPKCMKFQHMKTTFLQHNYISSHYMCPVCFIIGHCSLNKYLKYLQKILLKYKKVLQKCQIVFSLSKKVLFLKNEAQ